MTVVDLIDYLEQFDHDTLVFLTVDRLEEPVKPYISLDVLDYSIPYADPQE